MTSFEVDVPERDPPAPPDSCAATLPDVHGLASFGREGWLGLGQRLRAVGIDSEAVQPLTAQIAKGQAAIVKWELRRRRDAAAHALRMFVMADPVTADEAREVLGPERPVDRMLDVGLLREAEEGGLVCAFSTDLVRIGGYDRFILSDELTQGGDAVMGPSEATLVLSGFARPRAPTAKALDLGCGAGTLALAVSPYCDRVVATDVNPRAIALTQINAWMNGIVNLDLRSGDLFAPVPDESFDLIVSQPPYVPRPRELRPAAYLFGGPRGDEMPLRLLRQVAGHLAPGGFSIVVAAWPVVDGDMPLLRKLREAAGPARNLSMLLLFDEATDVAEYCTMYGAIHHRYRGAAVERDVIRYREHCEHLRIRKIVLGYAVLRRGADDQPGWVSAMPFGPTAQMPATRESIDRLFAEGDIASRRGA